MIFDRRMKMWHIDWFVIFTVEARPKIMSGGLAKNSEMSHIFEFDEHL